VLCGQPRSGRGVEGQGRREGPEGKHLAQLAGALAQARGSGAEGVDEGTVAVAKLQLGCIVSCVDERGGAAVSAGRLAMWVLSQDGGNTHGRAALLLVFGLGLGFDLSDDSAAFSLALVCGQMLKTRQGSQLDVECGGKLQWKHGAGWGDRAPCVLSLAS